MRGDRIHGNRRLSAPKGIRERLGGGRISITLIALSLALLNAALFAHRGEVALANAAGFSIGPLKLVAPGELKRMFPSSVLYAEGMRHAANVIALASAAALAGKDRVEKVAAFLWLFGAFSIAYFAARYLLRGAHRFLASREILILPFRSISVSVHLLLAAGIIALVAAAILYAVRAARRVGRLTL